MNIVSTSIFPMSFWLIKTEPSTYSWDDLVKERRTWWTGIRNFQARNNLRAMRKGDLVFVYHSMTEKAIKGTAEVVGEAKPDSTATDGDWSMVEIRAIESLKRDATLEDIKKNPRLANMVLVKNSRLSVQPMTEKEWKEIAASQFHSD